MMELKGRENQNSTPYIFTTSHSHSSNIGSSILASHSSLSTTTTTDITIPSILGESHCDGDNAKSKYGMRLQLCRMLSISIIPIAVMMGFTVYMFATTLTGTLETREINNNIYLATEITSLMHVLQKERDMSSLYCSAIAPDTKRFLITQYASTDKVLESMSRWPFINFGDKVPNTLTTKEKFTNFLNRHRYELEVEKPNSKMELTFYTTIIESFIKVQYDVVTQSEGNMWKLLVGMLEIVKTRESFGIERALGSIFFTQGGFFDRDSLLWFLKSQDQGNQTLRMVLEYSEDVAVLFEESKREDNDFVLSTISSMRYLIRDTPIRVPSNENSTFVGSVETAGWWFDNMTAFLDTLLVMQKQMAQNTKIKLTQQETGDQSLLMTIGTIFVFVILVIPLMIYSIYRLISNIQSCSVNLAARTKTLSMEKKRTDKLLFQMLPKAVAEKLKNNEVVEPVLFKSATVLFIDIVDFTALSAKSSPVQVVDTLNLFFTTLDGILAQYDVFKVETIGDAYMVASGFPHKNGNRHASEIALLSLHILKELRSIEIPHMPSKKIHVRAGCHTGPVIAGVVGYKMPRYCLFGETVTCAAKMESTGKVGCVQMSQSTNDLLKRTGAFITTERIDAVLEEKTYWLLHKKGMLVKKHSLASGSDMAEELACSLQNAMLEKYPEEELNATPEVTFSNVDSFDDVDIQKEEKDSPKPEDLKLDFKDPSLI